MSDIQYRVHQIYTIEATAERLLEAERQGEAPNIIWGHIARSGKSYMMNGLIERLDDAVDDTDVSYIVVTTAPKETMEQYEDVMERLVDRGFTIVVDKTDFADLSGKVVALMSKQLLTNRHNANLLGTIPNVRLMMLDEAHNGGVTEIGMGLWEGIECPKIYISATYNKVLEGVPNIAMVAKWDLEDIEMMKRQDYGGIVRKYPGFDRVYSLYMDANRLTDAEMAADLADTYERYPRLNLIGLDLPNLADTLGDSDTWDWSPSSLLDMGGNGFVHAQSVEIVFRHILTNVVAKIDHLNATIDQRPILNKSRPSVILCFLPPSGISKTSRCLMEILSAIDDRFQIVISNTTDAKYKDIGAVIDAGLKKAKRRAKAALIVLTGVQGHLGTTVERCDLVLLMSASKSADFCFQAMFRAMSEADSKHNGYIVDLNVYRAFHFASEYGRYITDHPLNTMQGLEKTLRSDAVQLRLSESGDYREVVNTDRIVEYCGMHFDRSDYYNRLLMTDQSIITDERGVLQRENRAILNTLTPDDRNAFHEIFDMNIDDI